MIDLIPSPTTTGMARSTMLGPNVNITGILERKS